MLRLILVLIGISMAAPVWADDHNKPFLDIHSVISSGGITAWLIEDHSQPMIAMSFGFMGAGAVNDPADKQGLQFLLASTLDEGAGPYDSTSFQKRLEDNSISLRFVAVRDHFTGSLKTLTETKQVAFEALRLALTQPRFDKEPIARMITQSQSRIKDNLQDPDWIATRILYDRAYEGHPYAQNLGGTLSSLPRIKAGDLRPLALPQLSRDRLRIGVVGDISPAELGPILDDVFGSLPEKAPTKAVDSLTLQHIGATFLYTQDIPQTIIRMLAPGPARDDPDYVATMVMNHIFGGGGFGSRLTDVIREQGGLTYGITSNLDQLDHIATLGISTSTKNEQVGRMRDLIVTEINKMRDQGVTVTELKAAQDYLLGAMPTALTSTDRIANIMLSMQLDQRPQNDFDQLRRDIARLTVDDINRAAKKWLDPQKFVTVMVGTPKNFPQETIRIKILPNAE